MKKKGSSLSNPDLPQNNTAPRGVVITAVQPSAKAVQHPGPMTGVRRLKAASLRDLASPARELWDMTGWDD